jgi:hypothetical protein
MLQLDTERFVHKLQLICAGMTLLAPLVVAETTTLRTGLWELTFKSDLTVEQSRRLSAKIPEVAFGQIPAPQRAELRRRYQSGELLRNALNSIDTLCITEEDLEQGIHPDTDIDESCKVVNATAHKAWQQVKLVCAGLEDEALGNAVITITASDPTTLTGNITRTVAGATKPFTIKVELQGKWLDSQCGEQAPEEDEARLR